MSRGSDKADGGQRPPDDADDFAKAMRGVRKLGGVARVSPLSSRPPLVGQSRHSRDPSPVKRPAEAGPDVALAIEDSGLLWTARADGVDRRTIRKLRGGSIPVEGRLDLHGLTRLGAMRALQQFVDAARGSAWRHLLIVHGRGLHSGPDGPSLPQAVREELTRGRTAACVLACGSASSALGGAGATFVFLRR